LQDGFGTIISFFFISETYAPVILDKKTKRLRKETGNQALRSRLESKVDKKTTFLIAIIRPTKMLIFSPIVTAICVYISVAYGILYLLFTTFTYVFAKSYGFGTGTVGLTFIPLGIGMFIALFLVGFLTDRTVKVKQEKGEEVKPEDRIPLPLVLTAGLCLPAGLFIYGWTVQAHTHWIAPLIGTMIVGFGLLIVFVSEHNQLSTWQLTILDVPPNISRRRVYALRCLGNRGKHSTAIPRRGLVTALRPSNVR
jgi:MFS family permease